ncbi:MAG: hypothetical protein AAGF48_13600 [Pseudomonadota bacterium]
MTVAGEQVGIRPNAIELPVTDFSFARVGSFAVAQQVPNMRVEWCRIKQAAKCTRDALHPGAERR